MIKPDIAEYNVVSISELMCDLIKVNLPKTSGVNFVAN